MNDIIIEPSQNDAASGKHSLEATHTPINGLIISTDTENFVQDVIEPSNNLPVIVAFVSKDHPHCLSLVKILEKLVKRSGGLVSLAKVAVETNQQLAQQLRIKSVPTVFGFHLGRAIDAFAGLQDEGQIQRFLDKLIGDAKSPITLAVEQADAYLDDAKWAEAEAIFSELLAQDSTYAPALGGLIHAITGMGEFSRAQDFIDSLEPATQKKPEVSQAISAFELAQEGEATTETDTAHLEQRISANPKDFDARFDLAKILFAQNDAQAAIDQLLEIVRLDRSWNDDAGRKQLLKIFEALGSADDITISGRKRLATVLFS